MSPSAAAASPKPAKADKPKSTKPKATKPAADKPEKKEKKEKKEKTEAAAPVKLARVRNVCGLDLSGRTPFESLSREALDSATLKVRGEFPEWNDRQAKKAIRKVVTRRVRNLRKGQVGRDLTGASLHQRDDEEEY